ncbi:hypothetical protein P872_00410 [Rhodonellum psychrophilum GCM71 = DSM 17998]|uniref:Uncharacterized protein n=1 Tax=Rhodonellum psychrophilum GCM71 = DSM 17998 TaxID=1123057 RepID=U5C3S2_9BACT|nr:hypothetical protein P872_00410 [Rhodonellum psychrophilum GCM71 = DSM 17998]
MGYANKNHLQSHYCFGGGFFLFFFSEFFNQKGVIDSIFEKYIQ